MTSTKLNLAQKIASASNAVGALATDKHNPQGNYKYISADKILDRAGNALADVGVAVVPGISHVEVNTGTTSGNKPRFDVTVYMKMLVTDGETTYEQGWLGMGSDYSVPDKATYKAITSGHKYFLAKLLNVGVGNEDSEHEPDRDLVPVTHTNGKPAKPAPKAAAKPATKPAAAQNDAEADNLWDSDANTSLERLEKLGVQLYGDAWATKAGELAGHASTGKANNVRDLTEGEILLLISGIEKKLAAAETA